MQQVRESVWIADGYKPFRPFFAAYSSSAIIQVLIKFIPLKRRLCSSLQATPPNQFVIFITADIPSLMAYARSLTA